MHGLATTTCAASQSRPACSSRTARPPPLATGLSPARRERCTLGLDFLIISTLITSHFAVRGISEPWTRRRSGDPHVPRPARGPSCRSLTLALSRTAADIDVGLDIPVISILIIVSFRVVQDVGSCGENNFYPDLPRSVGRPTGRARGQTLSREAGEVYVGLYGRIFSTLIVVSFRVVRDVGSCGGMIFREPSPAALRAAIL